MPVRPIESVERFVFASSRTRFVATVLAVSLAKTGVWYMPNLGLSRLIALDPFANPFTNPYQHYLFWNWLGPFVAWLVGATGKQAFVVFHLAFAIAFTTLFACAAFRRLPEREARVALLVFATIPASGTAYYWVGMDAIVLFAMLVAIVFAHRSFVPWLVGIALGLQHFEQGLVAGVALLVATVVAKRMRLASPYPPSVALAWIAGTLVGKAALACLFARWGIVVNDGRWTLFGHEFRTLLLEAALHAQAIAWSMLGVGWLVLAAYVDRLRRAAVPLLCGLVVCPPLLALARDETRVIAIVTFPLLAFFWLFDEPTLARVSDRDAAALFIAWLVVPWAWTWDGVPRWSALPYDAYWLLDRLAGPFTPDDAFRLFP